MVDDKVHDPAPTRIEWLDAAVAQAAAVAGDVTAALRLAVRCGPSVPLPGQGRTGERWALLRAVAAVDLTAARVFEPHLDALAILAEAGADVPAGSWGVWAAEAADARLEARADGSGWALTGVKPWCSLAGRLDAALVTATAPDGRRLFRVRLDQPGVHVQPAGWVAHGLPAVESGPVAFDGARAEPVGAPGWYLDRPGFAWGGVGVAACWLGGADGLCAALKALRPADPIRRANLGAVDAALHAASTVLTDSARIIDSGDCAEPALLAARVRAVVAWAVETTLTQVGHALGPRPLAFDRSYGQRVADLQLYVRQHHAERDLAALGGLVLDGSAAS